MSQGGERTLGNRLQQEIQQLSQVHQNLIEIHRTEQADFQKISSVLNQELGLAEGKIQVQTETIKDSVAQLDSMRAMLREKEIHLALMERDHKQFEQRISSLETELATKYQQPSQSKYALRRRKNTFVDKPDS